MNNKSSRLMIYLKRNKWQWVFYMFCAAIVIVCSLRWYNYYLVFTKNKEIQIMTNEINSKILEIKTMKKEEKLSKYLQAKYIDTNYKVESRSKVILALIDILKNLESLAKNNKHIVLSDFSVNEDSISLNWKISDLTVVYDENGLIDQFLNLDFINHLNIPSYSIDGKDYNFSLSAKINLNVWK